MLTREGWVLVGTLLFIFVGFPILVLVASNSWDAHRCSSRWIDSGYPAKYSFASGCIVQVQGRWMPERSVRALDQ